MDGMPERMEAQEPVWRLACPDWGRLDTVWQRSQPYVLWPVGDQPLLYHWLDAAVDSGRKKVVLYVADRPEQVRAAMAEATLWPLEHEVIAVADPLGVAHDAVVSGLPDDDKLEARPEPGWGLIAHWHGVEQRWLACFAAAMADYPVPLAIGRRCEIHASVALNPPFWIGDNVSVGPNAVIGPGAVIGSGSVVAGFNQIERAHIGNGTYLGPHTSLQDAILEGAKLLNLRHKACVNGLESFIAGSIASERADPPRPTLAERWLALRLWWRLRGRATDAATALRPQLLLRVARGELLLFGVGAQRDFSAAGLPEEWLPQLEKGPFAAFSYGDVMQAQPGSFDDALHTLFYLADGTGQTRELCWRWARSQLAIQ